MYAIVYIRINLTKDLNINKVYKDKSMNKKDVIHNLKIWLKTQLDSTDFGVYPTDTMLTIVTPEEYKKK